MTLVAGAVVAAFGLFLIALTGAVFAKPALAQRFFMSFASSARAHYVEQVLRVLIGTSLVVFSPAMWQGYVFWLVGWAIVVSSVALLLIPWQWHHQLGERVLPMIVRHMRLYAIALFAFGALLLYGVLAGRGAA